MFIFKPRNYTESCWFGAFSTSTSARGNSFLWVHEDCSFDVYSKTLSQWTIDDKKTFLSSRADILNVHGTHLLLYGVRRDFGRYTTRVFHITLTRLTVQFHCLLHRFVLHSHLESHLKRLAQRQNDIMSQTLKIKNTFHQ